MRNKLVILSLLILFIAPGLRAQSVKWKPKAKTEPKLELFHSTQSVHFVTATFLRRGEFEYEISHRFLPPISTEKSFLGIDGPARIRMGLAYGITEQTMLTLARSNLNDNVDVQLKQRLLTWRNGAAPTLIAINIGAGWNTEVVNRSAADSKNVQYYAHLILNTMLKKKLAVGIVPSYLYNSHIYCPSAQYSFTIGTNLQYYVSPMWSVFMESNTTVSGYRGQYNSLLVGIELETGGHFFKIFVGNNAAPNPSQFLAGSDLKFRTGNLRLGFNITRILKF
ncbi:DUF5777 family beta-barrel protein [Caldithrix abyssi]